MGIWQDVEQLVVESWVERSIKKNDKQLAGREKQLNEALQNIYQARQQPFYDHDEFPDAIEYRGQEYSFSNNGFRSTDGQMDFSAIQSRSNIDHRLRTILEATIQDGEQKMQTGRFLLQANALIPCDVHDNPEQLSEDSMRSKLANDPAFVQRMLNQLDQGIETVPFIVQQTNELAVKRQREIDMKQQGITQEYAQEQDVEYQNIKNMMAAHDAQDLAMSSGLEHNFQQEPEQLDFDQWIDQTGDQLSFDSNDLNGH